MWWDDDEPAAPDPAPAPGGAARRAAPPPPPTPSYAETLAGVARGERLGGKRAAKCLSLIFGASGYGKSTLGARIYAVRYQRGGQCTMIDPTGSHTHLGEEVRTSEEWVRRVASAGRRPFSLIFHPHDPAGEDVRRFWRLVRRRGRLLLFADELHRWGSSSRIDADLSLCITEGRHRSLSMLATVQTPPQMPMVARGNFEALYTFRQTNPRYAEQLAADYFPGFEGLIRALPMLHFLRVDADGRVTRGKLG